MTGWGESEVEVGEGVVLHVRRRGAGPPVILAHGLLDDGACWTRVGEALERDHDVIAYDARHHGLTHEPAAAAWGGAADLVALTDALELDHPALIGHSMGAGTVAGAIAGHPDRFRVEALRQMLEGSEDEIAAAGHNVRREAFDGYVASVRAFLARG